MPGMRHAKSPPIRQGFSFAQLKMLDEQAGTFEGYMSVFDRPDQGGDIVERGAFTKTLSDHTARQQARAAQGLASGRYLLPIFWNHDPALCIGGIIAAREDEHGVYVRGELDLNVEQGRSAYSGLKAGYVGGMSFGYFAIHPTYDRSGIRHLREVSVFEATITPIPMQEAALVMEVKAASDADEAAQAKRASKYGIAAKDGGNVTKPAEFASVPDSQWGDPVNYRYPLPDKAHADNAAARFKASDARSAYSDNEQGIIARRIMRRQSSFGESPEWWPPSNEGKAMTIDDQGHHSVLPSGATRKAVDFTTALTSLQEGDTLQRDWHDTFQAFVDATWSLLCRAVVGYGEYDPAGPSPSDPIEQAQANADAFGEAMVALVQRSLTAAFIPCLDDDGDSFDDPDEDGDSPDYMSLDTHVAQVKAGRTISNANAKAMQQALDTVAAGHAAASKAMRQASAGHKALTSLLAGMQPGASGDTTAEGGKDPADDKKSLASTPLAPGASGDTAHPLSTADMERIIAQRFSAHTLARAVAQQQG